MKAQGKGWGGGGYLLFIYAPGPQETKRGNQRSMGHSPGNTCHAHSIPNQWHYGTQQPTVACAIRRDAVNASQQHYDTRQPTMARAIQRGTINAMQRHHGARHPTRRHTHGGGPRFMGGPAQSTLCQTEGDGVPRPIGIKARFSAMMKQGLDCEGLVVGAPPPAPTT